MWISFYCFYEFLFVDFVYGKYYGGCLYFFDWGFLGCGVCVIGNVGIVGGVDYMFGEDCFVVSFVFGDDVLDLIIF